MRVIAAGGFRGRSRRLSGGERMGSVGTAKRSLAGSPAGPTRSRLHPGAAAGRVWMQTRPWARRAPPSGRHSYRWRLHPPRRIPSRTGIPPGSSPGRSEARTPSSFMCVIRTWQETPAGPLPALAARAATSRPSARPRRRREGGADAARAGGGGGDCGGVRGPGIRSRPSLAARRASGQPIPRGEEPLKLDHVVLHAQPCALVARVLLHLPGSDEKPLDFGIDGAVEQISCCRTQSVIAGHRVRPC